MYIERHKSDQFVKFH